MNGKCDKCDSARISVSKIYLYNNVFECLDCGNWKFKIIDECCRNPFEIVVIDRRDESLYFLRHQCYNCGGCINMKKPLSAKRYSEDIRGTFNWDTFNNWKAERNEENKLLYADSKLSNFRNSDRYKYLIYLLSDEWKGKRILVFERENNLCQNCKIQPSEEVHHLHYKNLFNEPLYDLQALCKTCHAKAHKDQLTEIIRT